MVDEEPADNTEYDEAAAEAATYVRACFGIGGSVSGHYNRGHRCCISFWVAARKLFTISTAWTQMSSRSSSAYSRNKLLCPDTTPAGEICGRNHRVE